MISAGLMADLKRYGEDRLGRYERWCRAGKVGPTLRRFHAAEDRYRLVRKANQVGGTLANGAEIWWHALGCHPWRETPREKGVGWVVVADYDSLYPAFCTKLKETAPPPAMLHESCRYREGAGYYVGSRRMVRLRDGYIVGFRSGEGAKTSMASASVDFVAFDEPPKQTHMSEALARIARTMGPSWITATMVGRPVGWLRKRVEGDPAKGLAPRESWAQFVVRLTQEECPWAAPGELEAQIASVDADEVAQRTEAGWEGVTPDRWFGAWSDRLVFGYADGAVAADVLPKGRQWRILLGADHGEDRAGAAAWVLAAEDKASGEVWVLDEWANNSVVTTEEIVEAVREMVERNGLPLLAVDECRGDTNTPGLGAHNPRIRRFNRVLELEFERQGGGLGPPFGVRDAEKGPGSVRAGSGALNRAMRAGGLRISSRCARLREAVAHWKGPGVAETKHYKDLIDALRYAAVRRGGALDLYPKPSARRIAL